MKFPTEAFLWLFFEFSVAEVVFLDVESLYNVRNREPADTVIARFRAVDELNPASPIVYDLFDPLAELPFQVDRVTGELKSVEKLNRKVGENIEVTIVATNPFSADNMRVQTTIRILAPQNQFAPTFLIQNDSTLFVPRNASKGHLVSYGEVEDFDEDDVNNDVVFRKISFEPDGLLQFSWDDGELRLNSSAEEWTEKPVDITITACNREDAIPELCSSIHFHVALEIPDSGFLMNSLNNIDAAKMGALANAIESMAEYAKTDVKVAQSMVNVLSAVLDVDPEKLDAAMTVESSKKLTSSAVSYSLGAHLDAENSGLQLKTDNIDINLYDLKLENLSSNFDFVVSEENSEAGASPSILFSLPSDVIKTAGSEIARVTFLVYETALLYKESRKQPVIVQDNNCTNATIPSSPVIVATVKEAATTNLVAPVSFTMKKPAKGRKFKCVYWNEEENLWSTDGLTAKSQTGDEILCESNHMSAFSILFDPTPDVGIAEEHKLALSIISYAGCSFSVFGCFWTIFTYSFFKHLHADRAGKILINLCLAVGFLNLTFVTGSLMPILPFTMPCTLMAFLGQYFALASFIWMGIEAYNMYSLLIKVFITSPEKHPLIKRAMLGWGFPLLIAGSACFLEIFNGEDAPYGGDETCKMVPNNQLVYYSTFLLPFGVILVWNSIVFVMVVVVLCKPRPRYVATNNKGSEKSIKGAQIHGSLAVMFLLGMTWVFGLMAVSHARILFQYIFCLTNSMQGFFIFMFRCVERKEARQAWIRFFRTGQRRRRPEVTISTSGTSFGKKPNLTTNAIRKGSEQPSICPSGYEENGPNKRTSHSELAGIKYSLDLINRKNSTRSVTYL